MFAIHQSSASALVRLDAIQQYPPQKCHHASFQGHNAGSAFFQPHRTLLVSSSLSPIPLFPIINPIITQTLFVLCVPVAESLITGIKSGASLTG